MADAKEVYIQCMESVCGGNKPYLNTSIMDIEHKRVKDKALHQFHSKRKMGGEEFSEKYKDQLEKVFFSVSRANRLLYNCIFRISKKRLISLNHTMKVKTSSKLPERLPCFSL